VRDCAGGFAARLAALGAGSGGRRPSTSRADGSAATIGVSIAGGSMKSVYSRRTEVSHPACSVSRTTGSWMGRELVTTSVVPAADRSTLTRPNRSSGTPSACPFPMRS
jgi:hypothetical protein